MLFHVQAFADLGVNVASVKNHDQKIIINTNEDSILKFRNLPNGALTSNKGKIHLSEFNSKTPIDKNIYYANGTSSGGGGGYTSPDGKLLDLFEARYGKELILFSPNNNTCFQRYAVPSLDKIAKVYPEFRIYFEIALQDKLWFLQNSSITEHTADKIGVTYFNKKDLKAAAYQDSEIIKISNEWLSSRMKSKSEDQCLEVAGLIVHEVFMQMALKYKINHDRVRDMTRLLLSEYIGGDLPRDELHLKKVIDSFGFLQVMSIPYSIFDTYVHFNDIKSDEVNGKLIKRELLNTMNVRLSVCDYFKSGSLSSENSIDVMIHNCRIIGRQNGFNKSEAQNILSNINRSANTKIAVSAVIGGGVGYVAARILRLSVDSYGPRAMTFIGGATGLISNKIINYESSTFYENLLMGVDHKNKVRHYLTDLDYKTVMTHLQSLVLNMEMEVK